MKPQQEDFKNVILAHDIAAPRYTSYPPAPYFNKDFNAEIYKHSLAHIKAGAEISVYIHIPFCAKLCYYCGCLTYITNRQDRIQNYVTALLAEARQIAALLPKTVKVNHLHFGGGSPTILSALQFTEFSAEIKKIFKFSKKAEIAIEADPRQLTEPKIAAYAKAGVKRISFGVQDFNKQVLKAINRQQPLHLTWQAVKWCREYGIENINFDIMYGLPYQSVESIEETVKLAIAMNPSRFAFFGYAHVPWMKKHMQAMDLAAMPDSALRYDLYMAGKNLLENAGYGAVGIDHFVKGNDKMHQQHQSKNLKRNFQGYTTDSSDYLVGIGASAISKLPNCYAQNTADIAAYEAAIYAGNLPINKGFELSESDAIHAEIIEQIMCYNHVNLAEITKKHGLDANYFAGALQKLQHLLADNLVQYNNGNLVVSSAATLIVRLVALAFDEYSAWPEYESAPLAKHAKLI